MGVDYTDEDPVEFARKWAAMHAKLSPDEQDMISTALSGVEANHSRLYAVLYGGVGAAIGALLMRLLG